jgi:NAD(P)-dependent dehydrogenase (short-subunit alcohol dehydrogenase family)
MNLKGNMKGLLFIGPKSTIGSQLIKFLSTDFCIQELRLSVIKKETMKEQIAFELNQLPIHCCVISTRVRTEDVEKAIIGETIILREIINYLCTIKRCRSIVILGSTTGTRIDTSSGLAYHLTKSFLDVMCRFYTVTQSHTRINVISLFHVEKYKIKDVSYKAFLKDVKSRTPSNHVTTVHDIFNTVEFLLSDKSRQITGQIISLDGGYSLTQSYELLHK